ncbi:DUF2189 domain-containing protein [Nocardia puris]|uniref:hypothetical protein n=1 Tax=Nocardia puris TaxID=208602 RepID=UPI002B4AF24F|nr:hypothetical protein [Nocardia puris]
MTDTPSPTPKDPSGGAPQQGGGEPFAAPPGQHQYPGPGGQQSPQQQPPASGPQSGDPYPAPAPYPGPEPQPGGHGRHEMPGGAGYPQFEGPGAAQYGNEPVEPPPPLGQQQPVYGPPGTGPGAPQVQPVYGYQAAAVPDHLDVGNAISWGLEKFRTNVGSWLGVTATGVVIYLVFLAIVQIFEPNSLLPLLLLFLLVMTGVWLLQAAMVRGALYQTDGVRPHFGSFFRIPNAGNVLLTALLAAFGTWLGLALCVLPGLAVGVLCMFALHFVVDQDMGPIDAIRSSATLVINNVVPTLLLALSVAILTFFGLLLCGIGLLVAGPVSVLAVSYGYRVLTGRPVAP